MGAATGANADTLRYSPGWRSASVSAPWPPIEWPNNPTSPRQHGKLAASSSGSSRVT